MMVLPELVLISTGIAGIIGAILLLLVTLISRRWTFTHLYILDMACLEIVLQFLNPVFHHLYLPPYQQYDVRDFFTMLFFVVILGILLLLLLLFFADYFRCIGEWKFVAMGLHLAFLVAVALFYFFVVENVPWLLAVIVALDLFVALVLLLIFLVHRDVDCLTKRVKTDEESRLRYFIVLIFLVGTVLAGAVFLLENFLAILITGFPSYGFFSLGWLQLHPVLSLIVVFKLDVGFRTGFVNFFKMCSPRRFGKVQFENLSNDDGRLLSQNV